MKKLVLLAVLAGFLSVSAVQAADPNAPAKEPAVRGIVVVVKDASGAITSVQIENKKFGICNVVLDVKGKELGEKMVGKRVVVKGKVEEKDGKKWVTVESYTEIQRPQSPSGPKAPGGKGGAPKK
jgi:hypothetical protein